MSLTTASASLEGLVSIEELSEALNSLNEDLKEAFSWKDVLIKLVIAAIAIAVVAIVLTVMGLGGFLAAVFIVFVAAIVLTLASFVITGAVNGWGTALGNAAENLIVVAAIGAVLAGATAGVGTFITQSVVPAVTNSANLAYASASTFVTTKALPAITKIGPTIRRLNVWLEPFTGFNKSFESIQLSYAALKSGSYYWTLGHLLQNNESLVKSTVAITSLSSITYYGIKGDTKKALASLMSFGTNAIPTTDITQNQIISDGSENLLDSLFPDENNYKNNKFGSTAPENQINDTNMDQSVNGLPDNLLDVLYPGENNQFRPVAPESQIDDTSEN